MSLTDEITALEKQFWNAMKTRNVEDAARMTSDQSMVAGATGVAVIDPAMMSQMLSGATWELEAFEFDNVQVQELDANTAIVGYKVTEQLTADGAPVSLTAYDTSVWRRRDGRWVCVLHTESLEGDPFGRDRR
jgi:hypothetical protein